MGLKVLIILLSLFACGLLVGNELAVAVSFILCLFGFRRSAGSGCQAASGAAWPLYPFWYAIKLIFTILQNLIMQTAPAARWLCCAAAILGVLIIVLAILGSVSSRPGLAAYCGACLVDFVRAAGSVRLVLASADTTQRISVSQRFFFYVEIDYLHPSPL
jgi:hypothetical protein